MKDLNYLLEKLAKKLLKDSLDVNDEKLLETIQVFDNLYSFMKDNKFIHQDTYKYRYRFGFSRDLDVEDETNYEIFKSLLELNNFKGNYLLDYPVLLEKLSGGVNSFNNYHDPISRLDLLITSYLIYFYSDYDDMEEMYIRDHDGVLHDILDNYYKDLIDSKYVSPNEKDILVRFNDLYQKYSIYYNEEDGELFYLFQDFVDVAYAYFVVNGKINFEYDSLMNFLNMINDNFLEISHKLAVSGIETRQEMLMFIKSFFKRGKILNKKQIK